MLTDRELWLNEQLTKANKKVDAAEAESKEMGEIVCKSAEKLGMTISRAIVAETALEAAQETSKRLAEAGKKWLAMDYGGGLHIDGCHSSVGEPCTCGLEDMRAALAAAGSQEETDG